MEMNDNNSQGKLRVSCNSCGKSFGIRFPAKPGKYNVNCPHCSKPISITFSKKEPKIDKLGKMAPKMSAPRIKAPILGEVEKFKDKVYVIRKLAVVNRPYRVVCPDCGTDISLLSNEAQKAVKARCKKCHSVVIFKAVEKRSSTGINVGKKKVEETDAKTDKEKPKKKTMKIAMPKGAITWKQGKGLLAKTKVFRLREGANTIGRKDDTSPSDIMIERDDEISRRSVMIDVIYSDEKKDFTYELKVLRNTNPVYINGRPMGNDEIIRLNYNDIICLGKTNITFIKIDKKK